MSRFGSSSRHLRRSVAPAHWPITRKGFVWTVRPSPGPHPAHLSIPVALILRDLLRYAYTLREARRVLAERKVYVDWRPVTDYKFPVGVMDIIYLRDAEEYYRVLPHPTKFFMLHPIDGGEAEIKPLRVKTKVTVKHSGIQLTFHDGRTLLLKGGGSGESYKAVRTLDTVLFNLRKRELLDHVPINIGVVACVVNGRNVGFVGRIASIQQTFKRARALAELRSLDEASAVRTILDYIFAIGKERPAISLPTIDEIEEWETKLSRREPL